MNLQVFRSTLPKLMSENNEIRLKAEEEYKELLPQLKLQYLIFLLGERVEPPEILQLTSILLRRIFRVNIHTQIKEAGISLKPYKDELINILRQPIDIALKKKIADAAAEFEKKLLQSNSEDPDYQWPEFLTYLFECVVSPDVNDKEIALSIISYSPTILQKHIYEEEQCSNLLKQFLIHCVSENTYNIDFRISAVEAASAFIQNYYHDVPLIKQFYEIVVHFINLIIITLRLEEDYCDTILKAIQDIVEKCSFFLKPNFDSLFRLCVETMLNNEIVESRRNLCLEIIASLSEYIPSTIRKRASHYLPQIINHLLTMMTEIEDDLEEWTNSDEIAEEDYDSNLVISETSLDRLATGLGGRTVLPIALQIISSMCANSENWKYRYAGLMAVATIGEGCHDQMIDSLEQIVVGILPFLEDNHPKIRYAACNAIGQLATDFQPTFQNDFHFLIMPKLVNLFSTSDNPRVQAHALAALVNFLEGCSTIIINKHIDVIAEKIEQLLNIKMKELAEKGKKLVLEQTIVALSSLADSAQENFIHYYDKFFPLLKFIIENALSDDLRILRGKTIECISLIGLAVGKEKFCEDATGIMNFLLRTQTGDDKLEADDPLLVYIIASWARICKILGPDFEPYLPYVMPSILKVASWKIEVTLLDKEELAEVEDNDDIQCLDSGEETFSIKTTGLEEKATACQMIICYARELKHAFANYVEETVKIMIPLLNFYFHERIRSAAAESLPFLIESGKAKGENFVKSMWDFIFKELIKSIESEPEKEVLCDMMSSLSSCIESVGKANITVEQVDEITAVLKKYLEEHFENIEERFLRRRDEDYDEGVEEALVNENDEDCYIMSKISEVIHSLFVIFNETFIPYFEILLPLLIKLANPERSYTELQWVICTMDDLVEFTGPHCIKYKEFFIPLFNNGVKSEYPEIRQSAAYGWGVIGKCGGQAFAQDCAAALPALAEMVQAPDSRSTLNNLATENAISSITKIMHFNSSCIDINKILSTWFSWLPIYEDRLEVPFVLDFLLLLVNQNHPAIVGVNRSQLVNVLAVIGENLHRQDIETDSELYQKICLFINSLKNDMNFLTMCFNVLSANHSTEIRKILNM